MIDYKKLFSTHKKKCLEFGIKLNPPAKENDISNLEEAIGRKLSSDIEEFYRFCNGFETDDFLFRAIPINEIMKYKNELDQSTFYFAEYLIYSDSWLIQIGEEGGYQILNDDHGSKSYSIVSNSVSEFLTKYLHGSGVFGDHGIYSES